jgi:hypothetical protein
MWSCAAIYGGLSELDKLLSSASPPVEVNSPVICVMFVQLLVFGFYGMKLHQPGVCRHDSVDLPYIYILL